MEKLEKHLTALKAKHAELDAKLLEEQKLAVKQEIEKIEKK